MSESQALTSTRELVKKHAGAIHIKNDISCLQRKVWNVLLHNAYEELGDSTILTHRIRVRDLMDLAGFDSKNVGYLKEALEDMVTTKLTWNIIDERGKKEWGVSAALASAIIVDGICSYAYSPHLRAKLYNPEFYAKIDILILSRFSSGHALALYENCVRYRNIHQTPYLPLSLFRDLIGVGENSSYDDFKVLNRAVIKPAMKEINTVSDINLDVEMRREKRKVVGLKFFIQENAQASLPMEAPHTFNAELLGRLQEYFCLTEKQAKEALVKHSEDRIVAVMRYTEERYVAGKIKEGKIAPYFLKILKDGDIQIGESAYDRAKREAASKRHSANDAAKTTQERLEQLTTELKQVRQAEVRRYIDALDSASLETIHGEFDQYLAGSNKTAYPQWKKSGLTSKMVQTAYSQFIEGKILPPFEEALEAYQKAHKA